MLNYKTRYSSFLHCIQISSLDLESLSPTTYFSPSAGTRVISAIEYTSNHASLKGGFDGNSDGIAKKPPVSSLRYPSEVKDIEDLRCSNDHEETD